MNDGAPTPERREPTTPAGLDAAAWEPVRRAAADLTPARLFMGSAGLSPRTADALSLRTDHAFARDAVDTRLDLDLDSMRPLGLFEVSSAAPDHATYLRRPELGRRLSHDARTRLVRDGTTGADIQVVIGDGLSAAAVHAQVPTLLPLLDRLATERSWSWGRPFAVRHCRVGIVDDVGDVLDPEIVVLLIGERPGLGTAESLSAYLAHRPRPGCTDADRNLVSNIHSRGTPVDEAAPRIIGYIDALRRAGRSGVTVKEPDAPPTRPAIDGD